MAFEDAAKEQQLEALRPYQIEKGLKGGLSC